MPGMNSGPSPASSILVAAFRSALLQQALIVALIFVFVLATWAVMRTAIGEQRADAAWREPRARQLLRIGFGALWVFDGVLQAQPQMAGGLPAQVLQPADGGSPSWVVSLVNFGANVWSYHPIAAAASSVWIQVGIGLWLIFAVRGWSLRLAALSSVAWGLVVWSFGESFGAIFAPGLTVLFGAPGGVLLYVVAGALLLLPQRSWERPAIGRLILGGSGVFFLGMALLQAWPGRGFWQGRLDGQPGSLTAMIQSMAGTPQPHALEVIVSRLRQLHRVPRVRGQPGRGDRAGGGGGGVLRERGALGRRDWPASPSSARPCSAWPTGCWWRISASSAVSAPTRTT